MDSLKQLALIKLYELIYLTSTNDRLSASPHPGSADVNSSIILVQPTIRPSVIPQNAPGSFVRDQKIAIVKTTAIGGHKKFETD
jgi:hypothetical protein